MSGPNYTGLDKGYIIDDAVPEFTVVKLVSTEHAAAYDGTGFAFGVCQEHIVEDRDFGQRVANVRMEGVTRAVADGAIAIGEEVYAAADGRVTNDNTGAPPKLGRCVTPSPGADRQLDLWLTHL